MNNNNHANNNTNNDNNNSSRPTNKKQGPIVNACHRLNPKAKKFTQWNRIKHHTKHPMCVYILNNYIPVIIGCVHVWSILMWSFRANKILWDSNLFVDLNNIRLLFLLLCMLSCMCVRVCACVCHYVCVCIFVHFIIYPLFPCFINYYLIFSSEFISNFSYNPFIIVIRFVILTICISFFIINILH